MLVNDVEVRQATNDEVTVGTVVEYDIKVKDCVRDCDIDGEPTKVKSAWIGGSVTVDVNGTTIKHELRYLDTIRHKKNGEENKNFKGLMTAFGYDVEFDTDKKELVYTKVEGGLIPKVEGKISWLSADGNVKNSVTVKRDGNPTRVKITSRLGLQTGLNSDKSDLAFFNQLPILYISTTNVAEVDSAKFTIEGVIKDVVSEMNSNGGMTGRYIVDLVVPNFFGVDVFNFTMLDKWTNIIDDEEVEITKEMFYVPNSDDSFCQIGDTVKLSGDIEGHSFGTVQVQTAKKSFGGGSQSVRNGYERVEWTIKSGDVVEDGDKYDTDIIATTLNEREALLDAEYAKRKEDYEKSLSSKNSSTTTASPKNVTGSSPFGNKSATSAPTTKKSPFAR